MRRETAEGLKDPDVDLPLTERELRLVIGWKAEAFFPDEERVLRKLRQALDSGRPPDLSRLQLQIVHGWAEEQVGGHYGGGAVANPDEARVLRKLEQALGWS